MLLLLPGMHFYSCTICWQLTSLIKDSCPPTTRQVTTLRSLCQKEWLPLPPSCSQEGLSISPCRGTKPVQAWLWLQQCRLNKGFLLTDLVCSGRGAITGGGAASSSSSSSSDTEGTAGVSDTAFTFCMEKQIAKIKTQSHVTNKNHKHWIKLLTEIALKQVQKNNNQNSLVSYSLWKIQNPRFLDLHGTWMCSPALPDTAVQTELLICLSDSNPLPKDLRRPGLSHWFPNTDTADQQVLGHPCLEKFVPIYTVS